MSTVQAPAHFDTLRERIATTRAFIESKRDEILELKQYYQTGIEEERSKLMAQKAWKRALELDPDNEDLKKKIGDGE